MPSNTAPSPDLPNLVTTWDSMRAWRVRIYASPLKPRTAILALLIADHINGTRGWCDWPSQTTLATLLGETGHGRRKIADRINELVTGGWIVVPDRGRRGKSARYWLTIPDAPKTGASQHAPQIGATGPAHAPETGTPHAPIIEAQEAPISGHNMPPKSGPDVLSTTEGVAKEHQTSGQTADPAPAYAGPVAVDMASVYAAARQRAATRAATRGAA